ncbi:M48 family metalloprotease [Streptomyces sp. NPDC056987]|uniref:M48 family metalloprotease n=1 Tax=Streptomyces sp. NPDC056987 TaxID=3345988 RepID=UPI00363DC98E
MSQPPEPQYPGTPPQPPPYPGGHAQPPPPPPYPTSPPLPQPPHAPDDLDYQTGRGKRAYYKAHQRGADATALGQLALYLPGFLMSLLMVLLVTGILEAVVGLPYWIPTLAWIVSGALVFHRPAEDCFARYLLKLRRPMPQEAARLQPVWQEVTARAGVDGHRYELWIENSQDLNAYAAAGHIVGVTRFALERLPSAQLAAVLAHELGHHTGGHAWTSLLGYWYSLPGRVAWRVINWVVVFTVTITSYVSYLATAVLILVIGILTLATITVLYGLPLVLLAVPYLIAAVGRRAELKADEYAAVHGFAPKLAEVLHTMHGMELQTQHYAAAAGKPLADPGTLAKLLATHPDYPTRLLRLQPYLRAPR